MNFNNWSHAQYQTSDWLSAFRLLHPFSDARAEEKVIPRRRQLALAFVLGVLEAFIRA